MREKGDKMKYSIKKEFIVIFSVLLSFMIALAVLVNLLCLPQYYMHKKMKVLHEAYESIGLAANSDSYDSESFREELEKVCAQFYISVFVMDANSQTKYVSRNSGQHLESRLMGYIFKQNTEDARVIEEGDDYVMLWTGTQGNENIEMYGRLASGISFIMSTPVENIRESAKIANTFTAYVGALAVIIGILIVSVVLGRITKPLSELSHISEKMVNLDFEEKYQSRGRNEIDLLGENINKLSDSLAKSISELKTANNELQNDIRHKEHIDEMRREFLANVSHELKTPIALIQGYAEGLIESVNEDEESRKFYSEVIMDEASKMNKMVMKLLTLNQLEFGNEEVRMERFDLTSLMKNYLQSASLLAKKNQIELKFAEYGSKYVWADEFKIEEVVTNYFSNAVNHCEEVDGKKEIEIRFIDIDGKVRVSVFNTGRPIPEESIEHLWEKFYKVDKARTREYGGSGVGLSIVKAIMDSMNQKYGVENYSNGVVFWFDVDGSNNL